MAFSLKSEELETNFKNLMRRLMHSTSNTNLVRGILVEETLTAAIRDENLH